MSLINHTLGVLFADDAQSGLTHEFFAAILEGFKQEAEAGGYDVLFVNTNKNVPGRKPYAEHVREKGLDGVAIVCIHYDEPEVGELLESGIPIVTIDQKIPGTVAVLSDNEQGMKELVEYAYSMGHRKIAYIHGDSSEVNGKRLSSFRRSCEELGLELRPEYLRASNYRNMQKAAFFTEELLRLPEPPTCILYPDDYAAIGGINVINARGLDIPADISVAGYDGLSIPALYEPRITTINQDMAMMGQVAARRLVELVEHPESAERSDVVIPSTLTRGRTVGQIYGS